MYESAGLKLETDKEIGEEAGRMRRQWTALTAAVGSSGEEAARIKRQWTAWTAAVGASGEEDAQMRRQWTAAVEVTGEGAVRMRQ